MYDVRTGPYRNRPGNTNDLLALPQVKIYSYNVVCRRGPGFKYFKNLWSSYLEDFKRRERELIGEIERLGWRNS